MSQRRFLLSLVLVALLGAGAASAQITEIIDSTGCLGEPNCLGNPFGGPNSVAVDSLGNLYVAGSTSDNAFQITPGGTITEIINSTGCAGQPTPCLGNSLDNPRGIAVDSDDNVYVSGFVSRNVFRIAAPTGCGTGGPLCTITEIINVSGDRSGSNFLTTADGLAVDSAGNIYVAGSNNAFKIDTPGTCSTAPAPGNCMITEIIDPTTPSFLNPIGLAVDSLDNVYVGAILSDNVFKIATPGSCSTGGTPCTVTEIMDSTGDGAGNLLEAPIGLAVDDAGNVYVGGFDSDNAFKIATPTGCGTGGPQCTITEIISSTGSPLARPQRDSVAVDGSGNVYVSGFNSDNALRIDTPGTCSTTGGTPCTINQIITPAGDGLGNTLDAAVGVTVDGSGNVYVAAFATDNVFKIDSANAPPMANAGLDQSIRPPETVQLNGTDSSDDNTPTASLGYAWTLSVPAGSSAVLTGANTATPTFDADVFGTYVATLVVTDAQGLPSAPDQVVISALNLPPTANADADQLIILGTTVQLDGSGSTDPENDPLTYQWSLVTKPSGSTAALSAATTSMPTLVPDVPGGYVVRLEVSDPFGPSSPTCVVIGSPDDCATTIVAVTAEAFAEREIVLADGTVAFLAPNQVTNNGNKTAVRQFLKNAVKKINAGKCSQAKNELSKAIERTDGCVLRMGPDPAGGPEPRDWILDCAVQNDVYSGLTAAFDALPCP